MSDHEFEKKVQLKMDELKFRPSEAVWQGVEKQIRHDRRRRRIILWLPILLLGLSAGGYMLFNGTGQKNMANHSTSSTTDKTTSTNKNTSTLQQATTANTELTDNNNTKNTTGPATDKPVNNAEAVTVTQKQTTTANKNKEEINKPDRTATVKQAAKKPVVDITTTNEQQQAIVNNSTNRKPIVKAALQQPGNIKTNSREQERFEKPVEDRVTPTTAAVANNELPELLLNSSGIIRQGPGWTINTGAMISDPMRDPASSNDVVKNFKPAVAAPKPAIVRPVKKWKFGVEATGGFANISKNNFLNFRDIFQGEKAFVEDLAGAPSLGGSLNNNNQYSLAINPPLSKQSDIRSGYAYSIGAFAEKPLSRKFSLSLGLQYTYNSVQITTGRMMNNARTVNVGMNGSQVINQYWAGRLEENYVNRYHYITLPVTIHWQLNKSRKLPVRLDGGVTVSHLLSSNALHYDGISGIYYKDNSLFNRTQVGLLTGLNIGLLQRSKHPVTIGPTLRYSLTGVVKKDVSAGQYLWSTGLSVKMLLKK